jgi:RHS repeat-associated protein
MSVIIDYEYDPLNRLTKASYSDPNNPEAGGRVYEYTYDAVGNRLSQTINIDGLSATTNYLYDDANRLLEAGSLAYTYDNNGNLLSDGVNTYSYDAANRLVSVTSGQDSVTSYAYNGLGDRLQETTDGVTTTFTMDLNTGLTQALSDGTNDYLYGHGRIAQSPITQSPNHQMEYFLTDALGSVRQLTDLTGAVTLARTYDPYGVVTASTGTSASTYGFTSEYQSGDSVYLRSRFYTPSTGRFLTRDTWSGNANRPLSFNRWGYVEGNPVNLTDPTGMKPYEPPPTDTNLTKYCFPLRGRDLLDCQKILLGIDPDNPISQLALTLYSANSYCPEEPLYLLMPHSLGLESGTFREYGWWWHYLMDKSSGPWKTDTHVYLKDVIAYALGAELATYGDVQSSVTVAQSAQES